MPIEDAIEDNAEGPKRVSADGVEVEQHDLADQIEADRYISSKGAANTGFGVRRFRVVPPGAV